MSKSIFTSKTFVFNAIAAVVLIVPELAPVLPSVDPKILTTVVAVGNILLRLISSGGVHVVTPTPEPPPAPKP